MKKATLVLVAASILFLSVGGCVTVFSPKDRDLVRQYCQVNDATLERIQEDEKTPDWVKQSAEADNRAFHAILKMGQWKPFWQKDKE